MIVFYQKSDGKIIGTVEGRIHNELQLGIWMGDKTETDRIICQWIKQGNDFVPNKQPEIFTELDKNPSKVYEYKVNPETKELILK